MAGAQPTTSILPADLAFLNAVVQDNTLAREFYDALYPKILYRAEAVPERWEANLGERQIFTRSSLLRPVTSPLTPGREPTPKTPSYEQWDVTAQQYGDSIDTHMPSSRTALANLFLRNAKTLGLNAGEALNRVARNKLFCSYLGGDTVSAAAGAAVTAIPVASVNGFQRVTVDGQLQTVSSTNPLSVMISGVTGAQNVVAAAATDPAMPNGAGVLTVAAPVTFAAGVRITSSNAPRIVRSGGGATIDNIATTNILTVADVRNAVATLRRNSVPPHDDGYYHVHLDPLAESQIFSDNEFQRLNQSLPDGMRYRNFVVGHLAGCLFFTNDASPNRDTAEASAEDLVAQRTAAQLAPSLGAEVVNDNGVAILRTIITGGGSLMEKYIDEIGEFVSEAGYQGKVGQFQVTNSGVMVPIERTRYIIRAPQDRLQQVVSQSWTASLDFGIPSDLLSGQSNARFKRAVIIESGSNL